VNDLCPGGVERWDDNGYPWRRALQPHPDEHERIFFVPLQAFLNHLRYPPGSLLTALLLLPVLLVYPAGTAAQEVVAPSIAGPDFHASVITFQSDQGVGKTQVEVYVSIAYDQLYFVRAEGTFRAEYDLNLVLLGPRGDMVFDETTRSQTTTPILEETLSDEIVRMQRFTFIVEPGTYDLKVSLVDQQVEDPRELGFSIEVPGYSESRLGISDILLADFLGESDLSLPAGAVVDYAGSQLFVRQGHAYIPNTRGMYANFAPSVLAYYEVYGFNPVRRTEQDRLYRVEYYVLNETGEAAVYYMRRHDKTGSSAFNSVEMNIQDLTPGSYSLRIDITDMGSGGVPGLREGGEPAPVHCFGAGTAAAAQRARGATAHLLQAILGQQRSDSGHEAQRSHARILPEGRLRQRDVRRSPAGWMGDRSGNGVPDSRSSRLCRSFRILQWVESCAALGV